MAVAPPPRPDATGAAPGATAPSSSAQGTVPAALELVRNQRLVELMRTWAASCPLGLFLVQDRAFAWANPQFLRETGYELAELAGQSPLALVHADDREAVRSQALAMLRGDSQTPYAYRVRTKQGDVRWVLETVVSVPYNGRRAQLGSFMDITARKQLEEQLAHQAWHDPLTQLPNRALFVDRLTQLLARRERVPGELAVLYVDLDNFKDMNDRWGHHAGDALLVLAAERLRTAIRPMDTAARFGGDEFTILLADITAPAQAVQIAERVLAALRKPYRVAGHALQATASIGLALSTSRLGTVVALLDAADVALYRAKTTGKDRIEPSSIRLLVPG